MLKGEKKKLKKLRIIICIYLNSNYVLHLFRPIESTNQSSSLLNKLGTSFISFDLKHQSIKQFVQQPPVIVKERVTTAVALFDLSVWSPGSRTRSSYLSSPPTSRPRPAPPPPPHSPPTAPAPAPPHLIHTAWDQKREEGEGSGKGVATVTSPSPPTTTHTYIHTHCPQLPPLTTGVFSAHWATHVPHVPVADLLLTSRFYVFFMDRVRLVERGWGGGGRGGGCWGGEVGGEVGERGGGEVKGWSRGGGGFVSRRDAIIALDNARTILHRVALLKELALWTERRSLCC